MRNDNKKVAEFYDTQAQRKLRDFAHANPRIECAWKTICQWCSVSRPSRILEIGCGVGSVCWRLSHRFRSAQIVGVDFSRGNLSIAERVFNAPNVRFVLMSVDEPVALGAFDLVILMDVYEHIPVEQRRSLHENLRRSLNATGRIVVTVPTPRHQDWLRTNQPSEMQPIDEDITPEVLCAMARDLGLDVLMYREVNVWKQGDYAHAVIGRSGFPAYRYETRVASMVGRLVRLGRAARLARMGVRV
jgi:SAM-dependent methyltransferase